MSTKKQKLLIVESPTKARTIKQYLGANFPVVSSMGHVRDLPKSKMGIDIEHGFEPEYVTSEGKTKTVAEIKRKAKAAGGVVMATDPDREGEAIAWHLSTVLKLPAEKVERVSFHEITKPAIEAALKEPRTLDLSLVNAQQARRVLDRLVGYELSPFLWKKIRYGLSAGRVQSVAVRLIVEREREREAFESKKFWKISAFAGKDSPGKMGVRLVPEEVSLKGGENENAETEKSAEGDAEGAKELGEFVKNPDLWRFFVMGEEGKSTLDKDQKWVERTLANLSPKIKVEKVVESESHPSPPPPFTTSMLQRASFARFGYSAKKTMMIAQRLYEAGAITYMRTDSVALSSQAVDGARKWINDNLGKEYLPDQARFYKTRQKLAQEAHEAIRPTDMGRRSLEEGKWTSEQKRLYDLIWRRAVACQCNPAIVKKRTLNGVAGGAGQSAQGSGDGDAGKGRGAEGPNEEVGKLKLVATNSELIFDGFYKVAGIPAAMSAKKSFVPAEGDEVFVHLWAGVEGHTPPPPRYTDASLVKALEDYGIGRPSTYASIIDTIIKRGYVIRAERVPTESGRGLAPTDSGFVVNDLLVKHFHDIVDYKFTAEIEDDLDRVAEGKMDWRKLMKEFYGPFKKNLVVKDKSVDKNEVVILGKSDEKCPECGGKMVIRLGKYGKFLSCAKFPECKGMKPLGDGPETDEAFWQKYEAVKKCDKCGGPMTLKIGRFGKFWACEKYPECKNTAPLYLKEKCPECGSALVERKSKKGRPFIGCSGYPKCKYIKKSPRKASRKNPVSRGGVR